MTIPFPQGSPDPAHPLWPRVAPGDQNCHDAANTARLLYYCGDRLVLVLPEEQDEPGTPTAIYGVTPTGMLSWLEAEAMVNEAAKRYAADCERLLGRSGREEYRKCLAHAARMQNKTAPRAIREKMTGVLMELLEEGSLPPGVVIAQASEIDADLTTIGTPGGVLDLMSGEILLYDEARKRLVVSSTPVEYDPQARHFLVDVMLPPIDENWMSCGEMAQYRTIILGYGLAHEPEREFMWEVTSASSGKTTFVNALKRSLGPSYISEIRPEALRPDPRRTASSHNGDLIHLAKPARFAFVREFEGPIDAGILKGASGGDDVTLRRIYVGDEIIDVTAHLWFVGNPKDEGGAELGVADDDENTRTILDRVRILERKSIPEPDRSVVKRQTAKPEFKRAALARLLEYTMACSKLNRFPPDLASNQERREAQQNTERADWQRDWLQSVLRPRSEQDTMPDACVTAVYENLKGWWGRNSTGRPPKQGQVTSKVGGRYGAPMQRRCPQHGGKVEGVFVNHVIASQPIDFSQ